MNRRMRLPMATLAVAYLSAGALIVRSLLPATGALPPRPTPARGAGPRPHLAAGPTVLLQTAAPTLTPTATPPPPVQVLRTCPIDGDTDLLPAAPLHIVFDQPMDTDPATVQINITPEISSSVEWLAPEHLLIRTALRADGVEYRLALDRVRSRQGGTLAGPLTLTFGQGGRGAPIPILMYHRVEPLPADASKAMREWSVSPEQFADQLDLLAQLGAHVVPLAEAVAYLQSGEPLPARPVVLTFDDGYQSMYQYALPIMQERGVPATFFISPEAIGTAVFMDREQIKSLAESGFTIGAHGYDHRKLLGLSAAQAERQFGEARRRLEELTGGPVEFLAYPYGYFDARAGALAGAYGYRAALAIAPTVYQHPDQRFSLSRIYVPYDAPVEYLRARLPWE